MAVTVVMVVVVKPSSTHVPSSMERPSFYFLNFMMAVTVVMVVAVEIPSSHVPSVIELTVPSVLNYPRKNCA